ncbi:fructose-1,6-bisphosphatase [Anaerotalea alkaliphila]|uniref:Fructose-1,6-bisphosphatase class 3 n=1 Tax=Anaerotalea alkaliphila TaxID=2662126 RepID=A0A7X5HW62_9FIRM|nr:fructose-1,6-bisphosphatase [Anaerotalea alkaliphila]NDL67746.1 fructose-1,6-bisphosphatase [Anaerotalea alkaliphila]
MKTELKETMDPTELKYLKLLAKQFPNIQDASREIINLEAILNLPKGTEHFLSDIHGEVEPFLHILKSGSGIIRKKIDEIMGSTVSQKEKNGLAALIYYPQEVLERQLVLEPDLNDYYEVTLHRLVLVCREVSSKYTRSKVRKALPKGFEYIMEELLHEQENEPNKFQYYDKIIKTIIEIGQAQPFIVALSELVQRLAIDRLHIIGDIYDRGSGASVIMDKLMGYHSVDIQWGNHDVVWMGACAGSTLCIANAIRISARYGNLDVMEEDYGINLLPLAKFALETYPEVEDQFLPKSKEPLLEQEAKMIAQMHKAISVMMFKLEGQFILRNPEMGMDDRLLLDKIDHAAGTVEVGGKTYPMNCRVFPTLDPADPHALTPEEAEVLQKLRSSFVGNDKLQQHVDFLFSHGSGYLVFNNNLLYHGCIPLDEDGEFASVRLGTKSYKGKALLDKFEKLAREAYGRRREIGEQQELDIFWYLWTGPYSSLFGKKAMTTFERYFIEDPEAHKEEKNPYYTFMEDEAFCKKVLREFGLEDPRARIVNGHVPVKVRKGESPVKANGRLIVIDGGLSRAYQKVTGIAGYTLIYNSHGMLIAAHEPFQSAKDSIENGTDIVSSLSILENYPGRLRVADTDVGKMLQEDVEDLKKLLKAYQLGFIK